METVDEIAAVKTDMSDRPLKPQVMKSVKLSGDEKVTEPEKVK
jgi:hypothetical protein